MIFHQRKNGNGDTLTHLAVKAAGASDSGQHVEALKFLLGAVGLPWAGLAGVRAENPAVANPSPFGGL